MAHRASEISLGTTDINTDSEAGPENGPVHPVSQSQDTLGNVGVSVEDLDKSHNPSRDTIVSKLMKGLIAEMEIKNL